MRWGASNNFLRSGSELKSHKTIKNWDDGGTWWSKKSRKKQNQKKRLQALVQSKSAHQSVGFSSSQIRLKSVKSKDAVPYRYSSSETDKQAHSSTNVLSYNSPSWRYIVDWKSFSYIERKEPEYYVRPKVKLNTKHSKPRIRIRKNNSTSSTSTTATTPSPSNTDKSTKNNNNTTTKKEVSG